MGILKHGYVSQFGRKKLSFIKKKNVNKKNRLLLIKGRVWALISQKVHLRKWRIAQLTLSLIFLHFHGP